MMLQGEMTQVVVESREQLKQAEAHMMMLTEQLQKAQAEVEQHKQNAEQRDKENIAVHDSLVV